MNPLKKISLQYRIFFSFAVLITVILLLTAFFITSITKNISINNALLSGKREIALVTNNLDSKLSHIADYAVSVAVDSRVISTMRTYPTPPDDILTSNRIKESLTRNITTILGVNRDIYMWDLVSCDGEFFGIGNYNTARLENALPEDYFASLPFDRGVCIDGPYLVSDFHFAGYIPMFMVRKAVVDLDTRKIYGYVVFIIREQSFASIFENNMPKEGDYSFYIIDERSQVISASDNSTITNYFFSAVPMALGAFRTLCENGSVVAQINGSDMLFSMAENLTTDVDWKVISTVPTDSLLHEQRKINQLIMLIGFSGCVLAFLLSYILAVSISRPILKLAKVMRNISPETMTVVNGGNTIGEVETLYSGFNNLMDRVNALLYRVSEEEKEKSDYQFQLIQAQIKPHFLYNTLETIKSLIELDMNETASKCLNAMATFYRLSLNKGSDIITLSNEIKLSEQYMYIQKLRYIEHLDYSFEIPESLENYLIPKMTLQPILENAIYHGIKEKQTKGFIKIKLSETENDLVFSVTDNGVGLTPDALSELRSSIENPGDNIDKRSQSFGLSSINKRIRLLYGKKYGLTINSETGLYTVVAVTVPKTSLLVNYDGNGGTK